MKRQRAHTIAHFYQRSKTQNPPLKPSVAGLSTPPPITTSMSRLIRFAQRTVKCYNHLNSHNLLFQSKPYTTAHKITKSPFEANILRILHNEIEYQSDYAPPHQPATKFNSFVVQDRPGEQWMTMRRTFNSDNENIKLEVTMFDGYETVTKSGEGSSGEDVRLHISLLVDISKNGDSLEFVCSSWPDRLEIHKVYLLRRDHELSRPYMGPDFRNLNGELQKRLREYLEERGVRASFCLLATRVEHEFFRFKL
ncbi:uncharacterized protein At2g39795, mitochondrial isoform X2 [Ricinus communis]|uniref:uncharacterized protein At2g39795, mitochondrial isoform X2 n=1 Tax=Ricinus communis TaxID=3988 RepID=UPI00201AC8D9|nr:uncharacterized protein At2g39795, mitochondrial isoform X2 [Ricinus communis]